MTPSDRGTANVNASAAQTFRPLISTAVDWPIVPASERGARSPAPTFGLTLSDARASLPAFVPPAALLAELHREAAAAEDDALAVVLDDEVANDSLAIAQESRRTQLLGFVIGVVMALSALLVYAVAH